MCVYEKTRERVTVRLRGVDAGARMKEREEERRDSMIERKQERESKRERTRANFVCCHVMYTCSYKFS